MKRLWRKPLFVAMIILITAPVLVFAATGVWEAIGGPGTQFVCTRDHLYGLSPDGQAVFRYNGVPYSWTKVGGPAAKLIGGGTSLYATSPATGDIYRYTGTGETWEKVGGPGAQFVHTRDHLYGLSPDKQAVFRYNGVPNSWTKVGGPARELIGGGTYLYAISPATGDIYRYTDTGQPWEKVGGPGTQFVCTRDHLYGLSPDQQAVFRFNDISRSWTQVGGPARELIGGGIYLYAISPTTGDIYRYTGTGETWEKVGGPGSSFVAANNKLYGVSPDKSKIFMSTVSAPPPAAPSNLAAAATSASTIQLTWRDHADNEQGFRIERNGVQIATVGANMQSFTDSGLSAATTYTYRVRAYHDEGNSAYSNTVSATTLPLLAPMPLPPPVAQTVIQLYIGRTEYYVNGQLRSMDTAPLIRESRTLLPIRFVAEPLGAAVSWDEGQRKVTILLEGTTVELWIDQNRARVKGVDTSIDPANPGVVPIIVPPGRTMLPLRFIAESLGCQVLWQETTREVTVTYPAP